MGEESLFACFCAHARGHVRDHVYLRRKGRMTDNQKIARARLEKRFKAPPSAVERSFREFAGLMG